MNINQSIVDLKTDVIIFAQVLNDSDIDQTNMDKYKLAELKSNLEALIKILNERY